jgi:hypothetical protein
MPGDVIATDASVSPDVQSTLRVLAGLIIPASESHGVPGADDDAIFADILSAGAGVAEVLGEAAAMVDSLAGGSLAQASGDDQAEAAAEFYQSTLVPARTFVGLLAQCYYRDDRVMASIGVEVRAPHPEGYEVAQGDWSLLDPVKARGPVYREV